MKSRSHVSRASVLGGGASVLLASLLPQRAFGADLIPLRIGAPPTDATGEGFYGVDQGFYKAAGLDVTITPMFNGAAMAAALAAGSIDILTGTVVPTAEAVARGIDLRVIAPGLIYDRGQGQSVVVVVATASPAKTAVDLNGKTIAVNGLGDLTHLALLAWLGSNGADVKSVKLLEVPFPSVGAALDGGRIDAALLVEPFTTALQGKVRIIGDTMPGVGPRFIGTVWVSSLAWLNAHKDAAKRFRPRDSVEDRGLGQHASRRVGRDPRASAYKLAVSDDQLHHARRLRYEPGDRRAAATRTRHRDQVFRHAQTRGRRSHLDRLAPARSCALTEPISRLAMLSPAGGNCGSASTSKNRASAISMPSGTTSPPV